MKTQKFAWKNKDARPADGALGSGADSITGFI